MNKEEMITKMQQLIEKMKEAADAYYNGQEIMSDFEYDALFDELQKLEKETGTVLPESPTFFKVGAAPVDGAVKVTHKYPALSLAKTKSVDDLKNFLGERKGYLSWKLDGLTLVATYIDGKLKSLVTRGNGLVGEDITRNAPYIRGVALDIPYKEEVVIRGEALCSYPAFEKINARIENEGDKYKNPRGVASGSVRLLDAKELEERDIHFIPFELVSPKANSVKEEKELIENCGMQFVESHCVDANNIDMLVNFFAEYVERKGYLYPTDGLVLTYEDLEYGRSLGLTGHHPRHSIAFKWKDEEFETTLREIFWSASKTGLLNPVAVFDPVEIDGTTVKRASVHNLSYIEHLKLEPGDKITVYKANMIIPQIARNLSAEKKMFYTAEAPAVCPVCGGKTKVVGKYASMIDAGYVNNIGNTKYTNDALISDHYAIIPTGKEVNSYNSLGDDEKTVYTMICRRFLAIFYPEAVYEKIVYFFDCDGESFQAAAKTLVTPGYLSVYDKTVEETEEIFSGLEEGESYDARFEIVEGKTQPPKRYTSGSIILAMENAGQLIEDADLRAQIKSSGIGTSATRAEILKKLIANNYVTLNKKTQALSPSERGEVIFDIVNAITPSLLRPEMTANWEKGLDMVASGDVTKEGYLEKLYAYVTREVNAVKEANVEEIKKDLPEEKIKTSSSGGYTKMEVKPKFKKTAPAKMPEVCPHCGGKIREFEKGYGCSKCTAVVWKRIGQTMLSEEQLAKLFCSGETDFIEFKKKDGSGTFTAKLKVANDWSTKFVFQERK